MKPHTAIFQRAIIRLVRGVLFAWSQWLDSETSTKTVPEEKEKNADDSHP